MGLVRSLGLWHLAILMAFDLEPMSLDERGICKKTGPQKAISSETRILPRSLKGVALSFPHKNFQGIKILGILSTPFAVRASRLLMKGCMQYDVSKTSPQNYEGTLATAMFSKYMGKMHIITTSFQSSLQLFQVWRLVLCIGR